MGLLKLNIDCSKCDLAWSRTNIVPGVGSPHAAIMIIGEAPGYQEDKYAEPFVGPAGIRLKKHYESAGFIRENFWITNTIKCRPPNNRTPSDTEITNCREHLRMEIKGIKPWIIVPMGATALNIFYPNASITLLRGKIYKINGTYIVPMYHPSYALRDKQANIVSIEDWKLVKILHNKLIDNLIR